MDIFWITLFYVDYYIKIAETFGFLCYFWFQEVERLYNIMFSSVLDRNKNFIDIFRL